jgi:hypothetical protein
MIAAAMPKPLDSARHGGALKLHRGDTFGEVSIAPLQPHSPVNPPLARTGTALAISNITSGVAALSAEGTGRGGARNRADRQSDAPTAAHIANLKAAQRHADAIGLPFTRMITIHWEGAKVPLAGMVKATGRFTDLMAKALARHGSATSWIWMHENVPGIGHHKGGHCHMLAHVPAALVPVVTGLQRGWLRRITGQPYSAGVILSKPIGGRLGLEAGNPELHAVNLAVAFGYVCKGAPQTILDRFEIERKHEPGGRVIGKRCGTSQNIGAKARKAKD